MADKGQRKPLGRVRLRRSSIRRTENATGVSDGVRRRRHSEEQMQNTNLPPAGSPSHPHNPGNSEDPSNDPVPAQRTDIDTPPIDSTNVEDAAIVSRTNLRQQDTINQSSERRPMTTHPGRGRRGRGRRRGVAPRISDTRSIPSTSRKSPKSTEQQSSLTSNRVPQVKRTLFRDNNKDTNSESDTSDPPTFGEQSELRKVQKERDDAIEKINKLKAEVMSYEQQKLEMDLIKDALRLKIETLESELNEVKKQCGTLKRLNEHFKDMDDCSSKKKTKISVLDDTDCGNSLPLALHIEKDIHKWVSLELSELQLDDSDGRKKNWQQRMELVDSHGIKAADGKMFVPLYHQRVIYGNTMYIPSFEDHVCFLEHIIKAVVKEDQWKYLYNNQAEEVELVHKLTGIKPLQRRLKQVISDCAAIRKRQAKDELVTSLNYHCLKTIPDRDELDPIKKQQQIDTIKTRLQKRLSNGDLHMSWWRTANVSEICNGSSPPGQNDDVNPEGCNDDLGVYRNEIGLCVLHKFMSYIPNNEDSSRSVETTFLIIPRLDAWINTVIDLLGANAVRGGARQKEYTNRFQDFYNLSTDQFIGEVYSYVNVWIPDEVTVPDVPAEQRKEAITNMDREGTIVLISDREETIFIAVTAQWFSKYITNSLGVVHDCFIATISSDWSTITPLGSTSIMYTVPPYSDDGQTSTPQNNNLSPSDRPLSPSIQDTVSADIA